jgi:hypothetical protein
MDSEDVCVLLLLEHDYEHEAPGHPKQSHGYVDDWHRAYEDAHGLAARDGAHVRDAL